MGTHLKARNNDWIPFLDLRVEGWDDAVNVCRNLTGPLFRGQANSEWPLEPVLHRVVRRCEVDLGMSPFAERSILREFKRRAHHHIPVPPGLDEELEWLALIQHHGGPTRLLDFTYSPYVAAFFALESADWEAALWSVSEPFVRAYAARHFAFDQYGNAREQVNNIAKKALQGEEERKGLLVVEPFRLNERMVLQQGAFLFPTDVSDTFAANLGAIVGEEVVFDGAPIELYSPHDAEQNRRVALAAVTRIRLPKEIHSQAIIDLALMNVTAASLFGGLDGLARSFMREVSVVARQQQRRKKLDLFIDAHGRIPDIGELR
jgi:hypothetical protein